MVQSPKKIPEMLMVVKNNKKKTKMAYTDQNGINSSM